MAEPVTSPSHCGTRMGGAERRAQLLDIALGLFARQGYEATTIRDIAQAAQVTDGLIYRYFASKEDLIAEVLDRARAELSAVSELPLDQPVEQLIGSLLRDLAERIRGNMVFVDVVWGSKRHDPPGGPLGLFREEALQKVSGVLARLAERGQIILSQPEPAARMVCGTAFGFACNNRGLSDEAWAAAAESWSAFASHLLVFGLAPRCPLA